MKPNPKLSVIHGTVSRENSVDQLLRELLLREKSAPEVIERLKREIDRPGPALQIIKN